MHSRSALTTTTPLFNLANTNVLKVWIKHQATRKAGLLT